MASVSSTANWSLPQTLYNWVGGAVATIAAFVCIYLAWGNDDIAKGAAAAWALGPPVLFWFEYFFLWPSRSREDVARDIGMKTPIWIAVAAVLAALAQGDSSRSPATPPAAVPPTGNTP